MLEKMIRVRIFEEKCRELKNNKEVAGPIHTCIGQEASVVGVTHALTKNDIVISTHRSHGTNVAKGGNLNTFMSEIMGKSNGCCGGRGGSMHLFDLDVSSVISTAIVGSGLPLACGTSLAQKKKKKREITCVFFGDGATNEGTFHESLNLASCWELPILFVLENNHVAVTTPLSKVRKTQVISKHCQPYGIRAEICDGQDVCRVFEKSSQLVEYIKKNSMPAFIELNVERHGEHQEGIAYQKIANCGYKDDILRDVESNGRDPIELLKSKLLKSKALVQKDISRIYRDEIERIESAYLHAKNSETTSIKDVFRDVYGN